MKRFLVVLVLLAGCDGTLPSGSSETTVNTVVEASTSTHTSTTTSTGTMTYVEMMVVSSPGQPTQTQTSIGTKHATAVETVTSTTTHTITAVGINTSTVTCVISGTTQVGSACFTSRWVYADMGDNPCVDFTKHPECKTETCCWNPLSGSCSIHTVNGVTFSTFSTSTTYSACDGSDHVAATTMVCGAHYVGNSSGGYSCIPASKL